MEILLLTPRNSELEFATISLFFSLSRSFYIALIRAQFIFRAKHVEVLLFLSYLGFSYKCTYAKWTSGKMTYIPYSFQIYTFPANKESSSEYKSRFTYLPIQYLLGNAFFVEIINLRLKTNIIVDLFS